MAEAVVWLADGTPCSPRFDDIYRSSTGGLEQARHVFLGGCGLPAAWAGQRQWRILETGFGLGLNFLAAWRTWVDDPERCGILHFVSVEAWPANAADLIRSAAPYPELAPLAAALAEQWFGLLPGVHRLVFEQGRVLLTLHVGDVQAVLRREPFTADSVFLDGFDPRRNPAMWDLYTLKAVARHCRRGSGVATWTAVGEVRRDLAQCGFAIEKADGLPPKRHSLKGVFDPAWEPKRRRAGKAAPPGRCVVIGAGLAGGAVAASLARRGWQVTVLDAADAPAAGASGLPAGLLAPHHSPDDSLLSRLSRSGVRITLQQAQALLRQGEDWRADGVLEHRVQPPSPASAPQLPAQAEPWTRPTNAAQRAEAGLEAQAPAWWHERAGWIKPGALVRAWLAQPGVTWRGKVEVDRLLAQENEWRVFDRNAREVACADLVVVAAAHASAALLGADLPLQPVRGQVSWAEPPVGCALPPFPVNGHGHFIPGVPLGAGRVWLCGSTFARGDSDLAVRAADHQANLERLRLLLPAAARQLAATFETGAVRSWTGVRCASANRQPLLAEVRAGLWVSTAMGSRGLSFAPLCAELLAARLHNEPLPLEFKLARALDATHGQRDEAPT